MTFASSAFGQLRYIAETVPGVTPGVGNGVNLRMTGPTMKAATSVIKSAELRQDRLSSGSTRVDLNVDGGFNFELSGREYDPFLAALMGQAGFTHFGVAGLGAVIPTSFTSTSSTITAGAATSGPSIFTALSAGSWFKVVPPAGASADVKMYFADKWLKVHASTPSTSTVITLDPSTPLSGFGIVAGVAGYALSQSTVQNAASGSAASTFTMEYEMSDISQFLAYTGIQVNNFELSLDVGSVVKGSFGFFGRQHSINAATTLPGSPVASQSLDVMNSVADIGAIYEAGTSILSANSFIKSVKLSVNNNARGQKAIGVFGNSGVGLGELALSGTLEVYMQDAVHYNKWLQGTNTSLAIGVADSLGNGYMIELDKVTFSSGALNVGAASSDTMLSLPFDAFYNAATNRGIRITRAVSA